MTRAQSRGLVSLIVALYAGALASAQVGQHGVHADIAQVWFAARAVLHGANPYGLIGPGRPFVWKGPLLYPLPAALIGLPLAPLSERWAVYIFAALGAGLMCWALTARSWTGLWAFTSLAVHQAIVIAQWSPLFVGAAVVTPVAVVLVAKPTVGAAIFAYRPSWWAAGGGIVFTIAAFLVQPGWVGEWRHALEATSLVGGPGLAYITPVTRPGGVLVLAALTRWRRPEARLLVALACIPHTTVPYEAAYLFLVPSGWRQMVLLSALTWVEGWVALAVYAPDNLAGAMTEQAPLLMALLYLPCVLMVLRRPNVGFIPSRLERRNQRVGLA